MLQLVLRTVTVGPPDERRGVRYVSVGAGDLLSDLELLLALEADVEAGIKADAHDDAGGMVQARSGHWLVQIVPPSGPGEEVFYGCMEFGGLVAEMDPPVDTRLITEAR